MTAPLVLLVEDNASDEELTLRALRKSNVAATVVVVRDGAAALDYLFGRGDHAQRDTTEQPRLVLLDLNLPKLGGLEVLRAIRADERTRTVPVAILTSSREDRDIIAAYDRGTNSYVVKPVDFAQFSEAVRLLAVYWLGINLPAP